MRVVAPGLQEESEILGALFIPHTSCSINVFLYQTNCHYILRCP